MRLSRDVEATGAKALYLLGDLWHAKAGRTSRIETNFGEWRTRFPGLDVTLIQGNHDLKSGRMLEAWNVREESVFSLPPFVLKHHPGEDPDGYVLCGHIHPAVRLIGQGRQTERLPCFWFGNRVGVLPAFGGFTGSATVYPTEGDQVFVLAGDCVVQVGLSGVGASL
jgi:DNA ligase-associated metallophosphoesterase